ncbi:MAG: helix-turn-helix domain-containing protein [Acidimicrobiales bacterium]|jgi:excisionase family DNA binding protein
MKLSIDKEMTDSCKVSNHPLPDNVGQSDSSDTDEMDRPLLWKDLQLFTVAEVSHLLGIGRSKVYELLYKDELKSVKIGGSRRIRYSDLGEYIRYLDDAS